LAPDLGGYFASVDVINDQGRPIELADLIVEDPTHGDCSFGGKP